MGKMGKMWRWFREGFPSTEEAECPEEDRQQRMVSSKLSSKQLASDKFAHMFAALIRALGSLAPPDPKVIGVVCSRIELEAMAIARFCL